MLAGLKFLSYTLNPYTMSKFDDYYLDEHFLRRPEQAAIIKTSSPRLLVWFNYDEKYFSSLEHFKENINEISWMDADVVHPDEAEKILRVCYDFLIAHRKAVINLPEHE